METISGVFTLQQQAADAARQLRTRGFENINLLIPGATADDPRSIELSDTEQPGMGKAVGGVVGAAIGIAGGLELGALIATAPVPGVGPVLAIGMTAAALLGAGGAIGGAAAGAAFDESVAGLPADERFVYLDALRQNRSVLFVQVPHEHDAERVRETLGLAGAESIDAARESWWIGLRSAEHEHYTGSGGNFARDEQAYRKGFEAALRENGRSSKDEAIAIYCADGTDRKAFESGYDRGEAYRQRNR
jgi:hypothetical protein